MQVKSGYPINAINFTIGFRRALPKYIRSTQGVCPVLSESKIAGRFPPKQRKLWKSDTCIRSTGLYSSGYARLIGLQAANDGTPRQHKSHEKPAL